MNTRFTRAKDEKKSIHSATKKELRGHIILVQEERFRMVDEHGRSYLFDLSHKSSVGNEDLLELAANGKDVLIEYEGEPELETGVVHSISAAA